MREVVPSSSPQIRNTGIALILQRNIGRNIEAQKISPEVVLIIKSTSTLDRRSAAQSPYTIWSTVLKMHNHGQGHKHCLRRLLLTLAGCFKLSVIAARRLWFSKDLFCWGMNKQFALSGLGMQEIGRSRPQDLWLVKHSLHSWHRVILTS